MKKVSKDKAILKDLVARKRVELRAVETELKDYYKQLTKLESKWEKFDVSPGVADKNKVLNELERQIDKVIDEQYKVQGKEHVLASLIIELEDIIRTYEI